MAKSNNLILASVALSLAIAVAAPASAQQSGGVVKLAQAGPDLSCRKEVKEYLDTMRLLRDTGGAQVVDMVANGLVAESEVEKTVQGQGFCAAAQLIRDKRARR